MKILIYLGHPAHFHLYKNVIANLKQDGHSVDILIKKKDILEDLLKNAGLPYFNILEEGRKDSKLSILWGTIKRIFRLYKFIRHNKPDILTGTSVENSFIGPLKSIPVINVNEDDADVVPLYAKLSYPGASVILNPYVCSSGKWENKTIKYASYHELAYLHPNNFTPKKDIVLNYFSLDRPFVLFRFAKLNAHHDSGIKGLDTEIVSKLIRMIEPYFNICITSEKELDASLEKYRMAINPLHIHDVLAFAAFYIGDSQTMSAEAGVLGVPFIRFNDFVGRIGYLNELENIYHLGVGIRTNEVDKLYSEVKALIDMKDRAFIFQQRKQKMLDDKIDYAKFLTWFIGNYPNSKNLMNNNPEYQYNFK